MKKLSLIISTSFLLSFVIPTSSEADSYFSPCDMDIDSQSGILYVAGRTSLEIRSLRISDLVPVDSFRTELPPKAIKIAGEKLLVACSHSRGELVILDRASMNRITRIETGHGSCDIALSKNLTRAFVCNQFSNDISVIDLETEKEISRIPVLRQPMQVEASLDGAFLFVANFLPEGRADIENVSSKISVIDLHSEKPLKPIPLANGSNALRGMCLSPDGKHLFITHNLGRFQVPTTQLEQGWMNTSALSVIDAHELVLEATVLLDEPDRGAPGSWGVECDHDYIFVAHSGTHDFSRIRYREFIEKLETHPNRASLAYDLNFLSDIRDRIRIKGNGPRTIKSSGGLVYVGNYFSDNLNIIDPDNTSATIVCDIRPGSEKQPDMTRLGEIYFNDASYCFQNWQSCNGCHPDNARIDGLNWDLLNDGIGNPKNCRSMLMAHETPPVMVTGIRPNAETAVRAGFEHIQFTQVDEEILSAVNAYLSSLEAIPSPHLQNGKLSPNARKGKKVFERSGCNLCHPAPLYTDLKLHTIGIPGPFDHQNTWDTPTLVESWRTGPYLHDGRCATLDEVFSIEQHGLEKPLSEQEVNLLVEYIQSL